MALYNEMRPQRLSDVKGQDRVVKVLRDNMKSGHMPNSMLFVGTRGTGKTTVAKIVAKSLNCMSPKEDGECCCVCPSCRSIVEGSNMDVIELDAASNNGVDDVRKIIELVQFRPMGKKIVVILDEVHMFSLGAFNALLKVMEEPPQDVHFILCTTELHKVPVTILSRCRKFTFENIALETIVSKLEVICQKYSLNADKDALLLVAKAANGSMRDAESIFETFIEEKHITASLVREHLGFTQEEVIFEMVESIISGEPSGAFDAIRKVTARGGSLALLLEDVMHLVLDVIYLQSCGDVTALSCGDEERILKLAQSAKMTRFLEIAGEVRNAYERRSTNMELILQSMVVSLIGRTSTLSALEDKITLLEKKISSISSGNVVVPMAEISTEENDMGSYEPEEMCGEPPVENITSKSASNAENELPDGFTILSKEEQEELAAMGFFVDSPTESAPVEDNSSSSLEVNGEETEEGKEEQDTFYGDFARQFREGSGGGFGTYGTSSFF